MALASEMNPMHFEKYKKLCVAIMRKDKTETRRLVLANATEILSRKEALLEEDIGLLMSSIEIKSEEKKMKLSLSVVKTFSSETLKSLLDAAVKNGNINVVNYVLPYYKCEKSTDKEIPQDYIETDGRVTDESIQLLIQHGFIISDNSRNDGFFMYLSVKNGHVAVIRELKKREINLKGINPYTGLTFLHIAELYQRHEMVDFLLKNGVDKEYSLIEQKWCESNQMKPLGLAVINSDVELTKLILEKEICSYSDSDLITYFNIALQKKCSIISEVLLDNLRDIDSVNASGRSLLQTCIFNDFEIYYCDAKQKFSEVLLKKGADVNIKDNSGNSLLSDTVRYKNYNLLKTLLKNNAYVNEANDYGNTALHLACYRNNVDVVKVLLEYKADVNKRNRYGTTPLHIACKSRNKDIIELLLQHKADPNIDDFNGRTPLLAICKRIRYHYHISLLAMIKLLMDYGAYLQAEDETGMCPITAVCEVENIPASTFVFECHFAYLLDD